ncbi:prepilin peptidase [Virgibacillus oceani]|uniref:Type 4 prepilin-like proteins leader peptide-processing enzyme n=1 Tax=Virgibacillus oceani TaxID=1479511 RepID=A0A917LXB4_9BACI|nr:A24 family peptidase [Virgibacillus oceani]GGG61720.1 type 4 prepilin-like proteins leader peptide-processing enzyme [Virgibacillus oceani]
MEILYTTVFFLLGLIFGSFFNVVGLRLPKKMPFTSDRSICPQCNHILSWYELVPVLSFLLQRGKCRHCNGKISLIYPLIELITGFLFAISYSTAGITFELVKAVLLVSMLVILLVSDSKYMIIPDKVLSFYLLLFMITHFIMPLEPWWSTIAGAAAGFAMIAFVIFVSRGGMGAGDMKLFGVLGFVLGIKNVLLTFFLSCMIGAIAGMLLLLFKVIDRKQPVPFGPYIIIATLIVYFYGDSLIYLYLNSFVLK